MKHVLVKAGITDFAPDSFRGADSSAMEGSGISLEEVLKKAGWTNATTFITLLTTLPQFCRCAIAFFVENNSRSLYLCNIANISIIVKYIIN